MPVKGAGEKGTGPDGYFSEALRLSGFRHTLSVCCAVNKHASSWDSSHKSLEMVSPAGKIIQLRGKVFVVTYCHVLRIERSLGKHDQLSIISRISFHFQSQ